LHFCAAQTHLFFTFEEAFMTQRTSIHGLHVATPLYRFIEDQVLPAVGVKSKAFWAGFDGIVKDLAPQNMALLAERDRIQLEMDKWHTANPGPTGRCQSHEGLSQTFDIDWLLGARTQEPQSHHAKRGR
jgi:malate synthase